MYVHSMIGCYATTIQQSNNVQLCLYPCFTIDIPNSDILMGSLKTTSLCRKKVIMPVNVRVASILYLKF